MSEHLPECWATYPSDPPAWCICDELRACEERLLNNVQKQVEDMNDVFGTRYSNRISRHDVWLRVENMRRP